MCDMHELELSEPYYAYWRFSPPVVIEIRSLVSEIQKSGRSQPSVLGTAPFAERTHNNIHNSTRVTEQVVFCGTCARSVDISILLIRRLTGGYTSNALRLW